MEIRIYVEGGGDSADSKAQIRTGFGVFFEELRCQARRQRIEWRIVACGSRQSAYDLFNLAQRTHPDAFNVLLVDSEGPVSSLPWQHLAARDHWQTDRTLDERYHLMVQVMEAWFIADIGNLSDFYGDGFNINSIPRRNNVEQIDKISLFNALVTATRCTQKGEYQKIRHGAKLLGLINPALVRQAAPHCDRFFQILSHQMEINN
jgi:hypothetical protein